nr:hypothetical protein [Eubacterium sp.]
MTERIRFFKLAVSVLCFVLFFNISFGMKNVNAEGDDEENQEKKIAVFHSNYPESWHMEEETYIVEADEDGNFDFPTCPFSVSEKNFNRFLHWYPTDDRGNAIAYAGEEGCVYYDETKIEYDAVWGTMPIITCKTNYPKELGLEDKVFYLDYDAGLSNMFYCCSWNISAYGYTYDEFVSTDGTTYSIDVTDYSHHYELTEDVEVSPVWKKLDKITYNYSFDGYDSEVTEEFIYDGYVKIRSDSKYDYDLGKTVFILYWEDDKGNKYKAGCKCKIEPDTVLNPVWETTDGALVTWHYVYPDFLDMEEVTQSQYCYSNGLSNPDSNDYSLRYIKFPFLGWEDKEGNFYEGGSNIYVNKDTDLYAVWDVSNRHKITIHSCYPEEWGYEQETLEYYTDGYNEVTLLNVSFNNYKNERFRGFLDKDRNEYQHYINFENTFTF